MRCQLAVFMTIAVSQSAFAQDSECSKILDKKNLIRVEMEGVQKIFFDKGNTKEEKSQQILFISRSDDGITSIYSYGADGKRKTVSHSRHGRTHYVGIVTDKGEKKIQFTYNDNIDSYQLAGRKDFEVRQISEAYESVDDKEGKREGNLMQFKFVGDRTLSVGNCTYRTFEYETKFYKFDGKNMISLTTGVIQYAPSIPISIQQTMNTHERDVLIRSFENRAKAITIDKR